MKVSPRWAMVGLALVMVFNVAWRWHTIGPTPLSAPFEGWLVRSGETEPLDCDESAYAYMGRRIVRGDVLYRDLTENKPPVGYWLYTLAVAIGGANEWTIRVMAIPYVLATIALVWWIGLTVGGPATALISALIFAVADTDPYLFGNGSNMEHFLNLFSLASLTLLIRAIRRPSLWPLLGSGVCLGLAVLVKQVAITHAMVYVLFLIVPGRSTSEEHRRVMARWGDVLKLALGFAIPCLICLGVLIAQGATSAAYEDIVRFARALSTDIPPTPNAPWKIIRWVTGNADPQGRLPWPFGKTDYLVWWGTGLWPFWLVSLPATARLFFSRSGDRIRPLIAAWTISAWIQVFLPGLFWQHYYLLPVPGASIAVGIWLVDTVRSLRSSPARASIMVAGLVAALGWSAWIQSRDYLGVTPDEITSRYKGGHQWVALRDLGRQIEGRAKVATDPHLFVWGWQSPLFIYSGLDGTSRHFFANELLKAHATDNHPLVRPWIEEIMRDLRERPPALIMAGDIPFPALKRFLDERYLPSPLSAFAPDGRGLWVARELYDAFHARIIKR